MEILKVLICQGARKFKIYKKGLSMRLKCFNLPESRILKAYPQLRVSKIKWVKIRASSWIRSLQMIRRGRVPLHPLKSEHLTNIKSKKKSRCLLKVINTPRVKEYSKFLYNLSKTDSMRKLRALPKSNRMRNKWRQMFPVTMTW